MGKATHSNRVSRSTALDLSEESPIHFGWDRHRRKVLEMSYSNNMDHLAVLREKIARLRVEIADLQELNEQYRREAHHETAAQIAHGQRHERLEAIRQELAQLADLGRRVLSMEERKEEHRSRLHVVKQAS
jgi:hypothetical protein